MTTPIGLKIKTLRTLHDIYQADLAEQAGINRPLLISIEAGRVQPGRELVEQLNAVFGLALESAEVDAAFAVLLPNPQYPGDPRPVGENHA